MCKINGSVSKYRPKRDPKTPKGPYYGPGSINKDPLVSSAQALFVSGENMVLLHPHLQIQNNEAAGHQMTKIYPSLIFCNKQL